MSSINQLHEQAVLRRKRISYDKNNKHNGWLKWEK